MLHPECTDDTGSVVSGADHTNAIGNQQMGTNNDEERHTLARKENVAVIWMRGLVFGVLLMATISVSFGVYAYTRNDQVRDFEDAFQADASKLIESFHQSVTRQLNVLDTLSASITSYALSSGSVFPNVTLPHFEIAFANSRILSGAPFIDYKPIVYDKDRDGWEAYQSSNRHLYTDASTSEALLLEQQDMKYHKKERQLQSDAPPNLLYNIMPNGTIAPPPRGSGPYAPLWQISPALPNNFYLNANSFTHPLFVESKEILSTPKSVIGMSAYLDATSSDFFSNLLSQGQYRGNAEMYLGDPLSPVIYPVFDTFNLNTRKVVGMVCAGMYWRLNFENILPENTRGIIAVLHNTQGQVFTFRIDANVTFLGVGDHHDRKYDYLVKSTNVGSYIAKTASPESRSLTSVDLNTNYSSYMLYVYPSDDTEGLHVNRAPLYVALTMVGVFLFTSLVFVLYTIAVNKRQQVVMDRAVASGAIVASLFPSQVRDQIYQENGNDKMKAWNPSDEECTDDLAVLAKQHDKPIADLFENTTVMFADMVGFTKWSSTRTPVEVFELLETVYQAFDAIAVRRKVFKVETIGDCYVAVAGLPEPQEDHAVIMAKFAADCFAAMGQVTTQLSTVLGSDTADLTLRIGLHSGSVTGGVLRGQKSRFQLFGDTMNTASRMESTGLPGRIHASQDTVHELFSKGKSTWVLPREDLVVAKGIGELQTYWVSPRSVAMSVQSIPISQRDVDCFEI